VMPFRSQNGFTCFCVLSDKLLICFGGNGRSGGI
jgi:hypothetical protein